MRKIQAAHPAIQSPLHAFDEEVEDYMEVSDSLIEAVDLSPVQKLYATGSRFERVSIPPELEKLEITDCVIHKSEAVGARTYRAAFLRVAFEHSRMTGADFAEASFKDCSFTTMKINEAGFRFATLVNVTFVDCNFEEADFTGAKLTNVRFSNCLLTGANFEAATCKNVDISTEDLGQCKGILGLKGATISDSQLIQIAPLLAAEAGFKVIDES